MRHDEAAGLLDDFVDGELDRRAARRLESHLADCPVCRREVAQLRALLAAAAGLPAPAAPERYLWQGIAPRLAPRPGARPEARPEARPNVRARRGFPRPGLAPGGRPTAWRPAFAAAAVLALALLGLAALRSGGGRTAFVSGPLPDSRPVAGGAPAADTRTGGPAGLRMEAALARECAGTGPLAPPPFGPELAGAVNLIDHNLQIVDLAIADLARARAVDPDDPDLSRRLAAAYRTRAGLLAREEALAWRL